MYVYLEQGKVSTVVTDEDVVDGFATCEEDNQTTVILTTGETVSIPCDILDAWFRCKSRHVEPDVYCIEKEGKHRAAIDNSNGRKLPGMDRTGGRKCTAGGTP